MSSRAELPLAALLGAAVTPPFLFESGVKDTHAELLAGFCRSEAPVLDWLQDFLRRPEMDRLVASLRSPLDETEEEEDVFHRDFLTTTGENFAFDE